MKLILPKAIFDLPLNHPIINFPYHSLLREPTLAVLFHEYNTIKLSMSSVFMQFYSILTKGLDLK